MKFSARIDAWAVCLIAMGALAAIGVGKFNDAGKKKVDRVSAELAEGLQKKAYPTKYLAFLVDEEFTFRVPIWEPNT